MKSLASLAWLKLRLPLEEAALTTQAAQHRVLPFWVTPLYGSSICKGYSDGRRVSGRPAFL